MVASRFIRAARRRRAFTLVELLVAVAIAALLIAIAIPALKINMRGQSVREAARMINSFIDEAKSQAAGSGRPFGVIIERDGNGSYGNPRRAYRLYHCETPIPYTGDILPAHDANDPRLKMGSRAYFTSVWTSAAGGGGSGLVHLTYANLAMVGPGDEIAFDGSTTRYQVLRSRWTGTTQTRVELQIASKTSSITGAGSILPEVAPTEANWDPANPFVVAPGHSFRVYRQPVKIASSVLELPRSAAIDLDWSGVGASGLQFSEFNQLYAASTAEYALNPIVILFEPSGAVRSVQAPVRTSASPPKLDLEPQRIFEPIYLLVARLDRVEDQFTENRPLVTADNWTLPDAEIPSNIRDTDAMWIKINPANGLTMTVQNAGVLDYLANPPSPADPNWPYRSGAVLDARELARVNAGAGG